MKKNKLFQLYNSLDKTELIQLKKIVYSPALNQHKDVIQLYEFISDPKVKDEDLAKQRIFKVLFPDERYNDLKLRHISSYLVKLIENMLIMNEADKEQHKQKVLLFKASKQKEIGNYTEKLSNKLTDYFMTTTAPDIDFLLNRYHFQYELFEFKSIMKRNDQLNLQELNDDLDVFYAVSKLKVACNVLTHKNLFKQEYDLPLLNEVLELIETKNLNKIPLVQLYLNSYNMTLDPKNEKHFQLLKQNLIAYDGMIDKEELRNFYLLAINYCIRKLNDGMEGYYKEVYELYKNSLHNKVLFNNNKLTPFTYKNIVSAGLRLKEYEWTENFIYDYKDNLEQPYQKSFFTFNLAKVYFEQNKYDKVVEVLHETHIPDLLTSLGAKVLLMKAFYELKEYILLSSLNSNFVQLLNRKKIIAYHKTNYKNFAKYLTQLLQMDYKNDDWVSNLASSIEKENILTEREWFLEKVNAS